MQKNESSQPPPVPPRRKRCKIKSKQPTSTSPQAKVERKHRLPPPLPPPAAPQRLRIGRKTPSPSSTQNITSEYSNTLSSIELVLDNHSKASKTELQVNHHEETNVLEELKKSSETLNARKLETDKAQANRSNSPVTVPYETNKYPPLYFTFQDYQTVMEDSSSLRNENNEKISEYVEEPKKLTGAPFAENITFHNEREEIYFRVTTTDRPFEKCLEEWSKDYDEVEQEFKEQPDFYIFEDYIDRSKKLNARPQLLFTEDFFSIPQNDNSASTERSTTRVRFLIESPSTSTPDLDLDNDVTNYGDFIDKQFENCEKPSIQLFEVTDEELKSIDENASNTNETVSELNTESKMELQTIEDENLSESLYGLTANQINDSYSDWEEDVEVYTFPLHSEINTTVSPFLQESNTLLEISKENVDENITLKNDITELINEKEYTINNSEIQEPNKTTKIIIDSSLYDLSNNNVDSKISNNEADNTKLDQNIQLNIPKIIAPTNFYNEDIKRKEPVIDTEQNNEIDQNEKVDLQVDKKSLVPVHERRSTFLETMLNENSIKKMSEKSIATNCKVIAAHPKQESNSAKNEENTRPSKDSAAVTNESEIVLKDNMQIKLTEPDLKSKSPKGVNINLNTHKSAGEVKGDVLNELLTNFKTIKLKPVNKNTEKSIRPNELKSERKVEEKSVDVKTDTTREIKRELDIKEFNDEKIIKVELNSNEIIQNSLKGELEQSANASINKDVCAIVKEASYAQRIENDNKITTPVIVSKDQYREAVSITPGSVRSFVKYYEIHSEISSISKIKDNAFKKQKSDLSLQREKIKAGKKSTKAIEKNKKTLSNTILKAETKEKEKTSGQSSKVSLLHLSPSSNSKPFIQKQSCMKSSIPSPKPERKKSVQFDNDHTVISPRKKEKGKEKEEEEGTFSSFIGGIRTRLKGKAPAKPEVKKVEQPKVLKQGQRRNESAAIFCIQKSPEAKAAACTAKSGNIGFLPQTETLQSNQTIVFYCTV